MKPVRSIPILIFSFALAASAQQPAAPTPNFPAPEQLDYQIEWHLITAGNAHVEMVRTASGWQTNLHLESAGTISRLYRVLDNYRVDSDSKFCPVSSLLDAQEGKRHQVTKLTFDHNRNRVSYNAQDLVKNTTTQKDLDVPACTREILSALITLRTMNLEPGRSGTIAITDGKKLANARIEAQAKETIKTGGQSYRTTRYEAFLFDNVLYKRKGRLLIWISDEPDHLPVQMRFQMAFPIGNIIVQLQKVKRP